VKEIQSTVPQVVFSSSDYLVFAVSPSDFPDSTISIDVQIKGIASPLVLFQTDKADYATGETVNYQLTFMDYTHQPLNQIGDFKINGH